MVRQRRWVVLLAAAAHAVDFGNAGPTSEIQKQRLGRATSHLGVLVPATKVTPDHAQGCRNYGAP